MLAGAEEKAAGVPQEEAVDKPSIAEANSIGHEYSKIQCSETLDAIWLVRQEKDAKLKETNAVKSKGAKTDAKGEKQACTQGDMHHAAFCEHVHMRHAQIKLRGVGTYNTKRHVSFPYANRI